MFSSPPFEPSRLRSSSIALDDASSSPTHSPSTIQRRQASLQRTFSSQMNSSSPIKANPPSDSLRDRRRKQRLDSLVQRRQAIYHAVRGGDEELMRRIDEVENRKLERELREQAEQENISIDELLALEEETRNQSDQMMADMVDQYEQQQVEALLADMQNDLGAECYMDEEMDLS
ncbi:uncharacterized protein V2V93DRAFT_365944 [Kockiozyma suomiensis]|uniref:uncharacterized protein n=1 Tax=Kockiozyma suomiensis TaxID=1337062 RepID=UPI0033431D03